MSLMSPRPYAPSRTSLSTARLLHLPDRIRELTAVGGFGGVQGGKLVIVRIKRFKAIREIAGGHSLSFSGKGRSATRPERSILQHQCRADLSRLDTQPSTRHLNLLFTSGLTMQSAGHSPRPNLAMQSAALRAISSRDCISTPAVCAVASTLSNFRSGLSGDGGSSSNTSSGPPRRSSFHARLRPGRTR